MVEQHTCIKEMRLIDSSAVGDATPTRIIWPRFAVDARALPIRASLPVVSTVIEDPKPLVSDFIASTRSNPHAPVFKTCVAPNSFAISKRASNLSTPMMVWAPFIFAA